MSTVESIMLVWAGAAGLGGACRAAAIVFGGIHSGTGYAPRYAWLAGMLLGMGLSALLMGVFGYLA